MTTKRVVASAWSVSFRVFLVVAGAWESTTAAGTNGQIRLDSGRGGPSRVPAKPEGTTLNPALQLTITASMGQCMGGTGAGCYNNHDCPGRCAGGGTPGEACYGSTVGNCLGRCSVNHNIRCNNNRECQCQNLGSCTNPPPGTCTNPLPGTCQGASASLSWTAIPGATGYDVVEGNLDDLHEGALFGSCLADNTGGTSIPFVLTQTGSFWQLVREVYPSTTGTYDEGGGQSGSRDTLNACP